MKYEIGDKVELTNGSITFIKDIKYDMDNKIIYGVGNKGSEIIPVEEERILRKLED